VYDRCLLGSSQQRRDREREGTERERACTPKAEGAVPRDEVRHLQDTVERQTNEKKGERAEVPKIPIESEGNC
jgi:hypothetical protein